MKFQGEYNNAIDPKGRASIPAKFREVLLSTHGDDALTLTKRNGGLIAYPVSAWKKIEESVQRMPEGPRKEDIYRVLIGPAQLCAFDKQGRIQLPQSLRNYAGLDKEREIVVVGIANKIEIWSQARHAEVTRLSEERLGGDPQALSDLGF